MNKFKISSNSAFTKLYDSSEFLKYSSDDMISNIKLNNNNDMGHFLFCYGSNSIEQIKKRLNIKKKIDVKKAYLPNHIRIFAGHSKKWNGGTATVIKTNEDYYVKGTIIYLSETELEKLDKYEGANKNMNPFSKIDNIYRRKYIKVKDPNDNYISCIIYVKNKKDWISYPSDEYLNAIKKNISIYWPELDVSNQMYIYDKDLVLKGMY